VPRKKKDNVGTAMAVATERAVVKAKGKPLTFAVKRILKRNRFSPLSILINQVFPLLPPDKKADALFKLLEYIYPKVNRLDADGKKKKSSLVQVNTQVVNHESKQQVANQQLSLAELLKLAASDDK